MKGVTRDDIFQTVVNIITKMNEEGEYSLVVTPNTWLVADLGFESIDVVVLSVTIQEHYQQSMPFSEFFAQIGQQEIRDIRIDQFADFVYQHLNSNPSEIHPL
jgi:acyl carrier protein